MKYSSKAPYCTVRKPDGTVKTVSLREVEPGDTAHIPVRGGGTRTFRLASRYTSTPEDLKRIEERRKAHVQLHPMPEKVKAALAAWHAVRKPVDKA